MNLLLAFIVLLSSPIASDYDSDKVMQSTQEIMKVIERTMTEDRLDVATLIYYKKDILGLLQESQKKVLWPQIACEARPEIPYQNPDYWKGVAGGNYTENEMYLNQRAALLNVDCANETSITLDFHQCLCGKTYNIKFCMILEAKHHTTDLRLQNERAMGFGLSSEDAFNVAEDHAAFTNHKADIYYDLKQANDNYGPWLSEFCIMTPEMHRILRKLLKVDIRFRIIDDLIKMKFLSLVQFNFCDQNYLLSKCLCDEGSSAAFCIGFFYKQAAHLYYNESLCDDYHPTSSSSPFLSLSFVTSLLLSLVLTVF